MSNKTFNVKQNIGKVRHAVSFHDGVKTHADGSPFFDMRTFSRKRDAESFVKELKADGYAEGTVLDAMRKKDPNKSGTALEVVQGMARAFFMSAFADAYEEADDSSKRKREIGNMSGRNFDEVTPKENDKGAVDAANEVADALQRAHGMADMAELYHAAMQAKELCRGDRTMTPHNFGWYIAMDAMGHGVGLADAFGDAVENFVKVEYHEFGMGHLEKDYF